ncbi:MAG: 50S ribosomal protein L24e [ANME-2 cluster archaeon HR1]|nr:50S ribosomal protein L24e [Euryarchaeota archaeon]PPA79059.1 MAG: 50S ribosomal protein L24e [ANME-2 cluster archaeon HR1]
MEMRRCSFCSGDISIGTGKMFVKKDGTVLYFCSSKCEKNMRLGRIPRRVKWTSEYRKLKSQ